MEISFKGSIGWDDFRRATEMRGMNRLGLALAWAFMAVLACLGVWGWISRDAPLAVWPTVFVLLFAFLLVMRRRAARRNWERTAQFAEAFSGTVSDEGIVKEAPSGRYEEKWRAYIGYRAADDMVLLYCAPNVVTPFPRSHFDSAFRASLSVNT